MFVIKKLIIFKLKRLYFIFFLFRDYNKENIFKKIYSKNYWGSD